MTAARVPSLVSLQQRTLRTQAIRGSRWLERIKFEWTHSNLMRSDWGVCRNPPPSGREPKWRLNAGLIV